MSRIYFDVCCLCRQFDDQTNSRIALEAYAIIQILKTIDSKANEMVMSEVIYYELNKIPDFIKREQIKNTINHVLPVNKINEKALMRSEELREMGFAGIDSLHIAMGEINNAEYFITTDDKIVKIYHKNKEKIQVNILNPIDYLRS